MDRHENQSGDGDLSQERQSSGEPVEGSGGGSDTADQAADGEPVKPEWKFRKNLPIQERMAEVIRLTIEASRKQIEAERKKLRKMQYGS